MQGRSRMAEVAAEHSDAWRDLGVAILHRLVIENLLGRQGPAQAHLCAPGGEVIDELGERRVSAGRPGHAGHGRPHRSGQHHGERMPAKSTYFYPKLLSGLVINPLE